MIKPAFDRSLSLIGLIVLAPVYGAVSLAIVLDDPGTVMFTQKRIGKGKTIFLLHKFRSMKMSTPHDIPTHQLTDPEQYITRVGKLLRKTSLDELPQLWDIFTGKMSIIGPRPALWNQDDLVAERDRYGANDVLPGLTGWAQINGRDELTIPVKAKLDGEYVKHLNKGGLDAFAFDLRCFFGTIKSVLGSDGVVEGGTGTMAKENDDCEEDLPADDFGCDHSFNISKDRANRKTVLITGAHSYIGTSFRHYVQQKYHDLIRVKTLDLHDESWKEHDFSKYDAVFHVAGMAHSDVSNVDESIKKKYYEINTELTKAVAVKAKESGVSQFIFMSSMIIYGASVKAGEFRAIDRYSKPSPENFYGDSKLKADIAVRRLSCDGFNTAVIRSPMVYGKNSKGNYRMLEKIAGVAPVFPEISNRRSMIDIDTLCEFVSLLVLSGEGGIYFPQDREYVNTTEMVKALAREKNRKLQTSKALGVMVRFADLLPGKVGAYADKAFGSIVYDQRLSEYEGMEYR